MTTTFTTSGAPWTTTCTVARPSSGRVFWNPTLDALTREVGLYPYVSEPESLAFADLLAYEAHRPETLPNYVFHRLQAKVYELLLSGRNVILSAPTSFGKSKIIDAVVRKEKFANIAIVVPTLALIDETRRRLAGHKTSYKIITATSQTPAERNLFLLTAERLRDFPKMPRIEFFVIDEFYKLGRDEENRKVALNLAMNRLLKDEGQFYLLGPNIDEIPAEVPDTLNAEWIRTNFNTVVSERSPVEKRGTREERLVALCKRLTEPTIIYCKSPKSVSDVAALLVREGVGVDSPAMEAAAAWVGENYHPEWTLVSALKRGIGIHHGPLPRSLGQFVVRAFNSDQLQFLVCTSTLIEGVNTKAKNVIIYDKTTGRKDLDYFTYSNIEGRAGRMFEHFIGHVYMFTPPPEQQDEFLDLPLVTQGEDTPLSLLMQLEPRDLKKEAAERLKPYENQDVLPVELLRDNKVDPDQQIALAEALGELSRADAERVAWTRFPRYKELEISCQLIKDHFLADNKQVTGPGLTWRTWQLMTDALNHSDQSPSRRINNELAALNPKYRAKSPDDAVERVLGFDRRWASFELPQHLTVLSSIQAYVFERRGLPVGNYRMFTTRLSALFAAPILTSLDEYGVPPIVGAKLIRYLRSEDDIDLALASLRDLDLGRVGLGHFEHELARDAQLHL